MFFMVIERFKSGSANAIYSRIRDHGRMLPKGLKYVDSWVDVNLARCFQLMECDDSGLFEEWVVHWQDLVDFEIVRVVSSKAAAEAVNNAQRT
jgi:hypothetical protein